MGEADITNRPLCWLLPCSMDGKCDVNKGVFQDMVILAMQWESFVRCVLDYGKLAEK